MPAHQAMICALEPHALTRSGRATGPVAQQPPSRTESFASSRGTEALRRLPRRGPGVAYRGIDWSQIRRPPDGAVARVRSYPERGAWNTSTKGPRCGTPTMAWPVRCHSATEACKCRVTSSTAYADRAVVEAAALQRSLSE